MSKYKNELAAMFGDDYSLNETCYLVTQEQLSRFLYLRYKAGAENGVRNLEMTGVPPGWKIEGGGIDLRPLACHDQTPAPEPSIKSLAEELEAVWALKDTIDAGGEIKISNGATVVIANSKHVLTVLRAQEVKLQKAIVVNMHRKTL